MSLFIRTTDIVSAEIRVKQVSCGTAFYSKALVLSGCSMLSVDTRGGAIALFVVALLLLGALLRHGDPARDALHKRMFSASSTCRPAPGRHTCNKFDCVGTWGALLNLAERKGRHTAHTWMDFSIGFFLVSLVCGL